MKRTNEQAHFDFLVFVNRAKEPIAGFTLEAHAREWAEENYPDAYEIRPDDAEAKSEAGVEGER